VRALVTRPREDAGSLVEALRARGIDAVVEPMLRIRLRENVALDLEGVQALLFTSANGARAAAAATAARDLPVLAVGDATAGEARALGWTEVASAGGTVEDLARLAAERLKPEHGALLHVAGSAVAGDLVRLLGGFSVRRTVLYDAEPAEGFSPEAEALLCDGGIDLAFFFSPRTALRFAELARGLPTRLDGATAFCLAPAVADAVGTLGWRAVETAAAPTQASLLAALDAVLAGRHDAPSSSKGDAMSEPAAPPQAEGPTAPAAAPEPLRAAPEAGRARTERTGGGAFWPVLALVLVLAVVAASPFIAPALPWGPKHAAGVTPGDLETLARRVTALENRPTGSAVPAEIAERLGRLEQRAGADVPADLAERVQRLEERPAGQVSGDLAERVQRLEDRPAQPGLPPELLQRLEALERRPAADPEAVRLAQQEAQRLAGALEAAQQRLAALEQQQRTEAAADRTDQALLLAVSQLRQAAATSRPFATELAAASTMAKERAEIAAELRKLEPYAGKGVPTAAMLRQQFEPAAAAIVRAGSAPPPEGWTDQMLARLRGLVTIRRVGTQGPEGGVDASVAAAEQALAQGDLAAAVAALEPLQGAAAEAARPWLDAARQRLAVDAALGAANGALMARLGADGKS
jgi:uroporphyrinogen-III synthase